MNVIGINFGTSYTSIGYLNKEGRADCLANEEGDRQIASVLAFHGEEEVVGSQAKSDIARHPKTTVANFRATLGKNFGDAENLTGSAAEIINKENTPAYEIEFEEKKEAFTARTISAKFLSHIRESAEQFLGAPVSGVVLAVPSHFSEQQRSELVAAAEEAKLKVLQLVNEATASALAYGIGQESTTAHPTDKTLVVCDLGAHSFDVTVLTVRSGIYSVVATAHDTKLGGSSFDDLLITHFAAEFKKKTKVSIDANIKALAKLRGAVEVTKKMLSSATSAPCFVESLAEGFDLHGTVNRMRFEIMSNKVFARIQEVVREVLTKADIVSSEVDEVLLAGGAARIPKFAVKIRDIFSSEQTKIRAELESDEIVARGCAIQGSLIAGFEKEDIDASVHPIITLVPHTEKAIGVLNANKEFVSIIPRGTALPVRRVFEFSNATENQTHAYLALHEGDHTVEKTEIPAEPVEEDEEPLEPEVITKVITKPAALLAELNLPLEHGQKVKASKIEVQVTVDAENKLTVVMREKNGGNVVKAEVSK
ncbi:heat shock protein 70 family [Spinellus fusiger]|nr:heat shock protein 70 family [Spinellus fusiger]